MNSKKEDCCLIPFKCVSVKCCKCYINYWKSLRQSKEANIIDHDYSIEKVKTFQKFFIEDKTLLHFCVECFERVLVTIPLSVTISKIRSRSRGGCVTAYLVGEILPEDICTACINFVVERFTDDFIII